MSFDGTGKESPGDLILELTVARKVNFASSQNGVSILKKVQLQNLSDTPLDNITLDLTCMPGLIRSKSWTLDRLVPGQRQDLHDLETPLDTSLLGGLNEAELGDLHFLVRQGDTDLLIERRPIEMLARDEWGGVGDMAHLLAAFVSPNDAVVAGILKEASRLLEGAGQNGAMDGYQSRDPAGAWMLAGAIWSAVTGMGLTYAVPPASFETRGQKVRDPGRIKSEGLATCLDSALLLAGCFEAAGLNPVVLFSEGHAWTGVWLTERDFGAVSEPDVMTVRKAIDAREFVVMETTLLTKKPSVGFEQAVETARELTSERNEHSFVMAVDIRRARAARIRPLAGHRLERESEMEEPVASPAALPQPLDLGLLPGELIEDAAATPADRISRWQRKLLDLSLRNRLLNFKDSKQTLPFLCPDVSALEDQLADGKKFRALALKDEDPVGTRDLLAQEEPRLLAEVAKDAFGKGQIAVPLTRKESDRRLLELHRRAKSDMQEGGTNTLFLAAGFLRWKKSEGDTRNYRAPLLLVPVKISRKSAQSEFVIEHHEDEVRFNTTLLEFLKRDFDLQVPELEGDLPRDESGFDLPRIFEIMRHKVRDVAGFEVVEELALSTFSFAKFLMWKDLVERTDSLRESALVKHLVDNPTEPFLAEDMPGLPMAVDVDRRLAPRDLFTPLPADSSQLAAVLAAQEGHDFVLIGPPGTGKSQTIANIISQCLAMQKTVLFVAEKSAALDVVQRRLASHGLGDAVLELHSNKSDRKSVLSQLGRSWARSASGARDEWIEVTDELSVTREQLNTYVTALHAKGTQGFSVFQAIGTATGHEHPFSLSFAHKDAHDAESYTHLRKMAESLGRCRDIVADRKPLPLVQAEEWSFGWQADLLDRCAKLSTATRELAEATEALAHHAGLTWTGTGETAELAPLLALSSIPADGDDVSWALAHDVEEMQAQAEMLRDRLAAYTAAAGRTAGRYPMDRLDSIPLDQLDANWRLAQTKMWPFSVFAKSSVRKLLQTYAEGGKADPHSDITALADANRARAEIEATPLTECPAVKGVETDAAHLASWIEQARTMKAALAEAAPAVSDPARWDGACLSLAKRSAGDLRNAVTLFQRKHDTWKEHIAAFAQVSQASPEGLALSELLVALQEIQDNKEHLQDWTRWIEVRSQAKGAGLDALVLAVEEGRIEGDVDAAFAAAYAAWWLPRTMDAQPELRGFSHWSHEDAIRRFRALDDRATEMAAGQVLSRIQHGLPAQDGVPRKSELGTLRHQLNLQRPSMPIRKLISEMPDAFTKLAPCVLMSPLSVAQYLPAGQAAFDVVIFDEASQITTWDAIGAIARGKQAIIVGDPKQLPPTNFFGRSDSGEEELPESERDLASILDEVAAAGIPTQQLDWHYRSRDEALIAFSNWHYYGGRLVTFPSPETASGAVSLHQVDGVYGRGQGRTNEAEARAIVRMTVRRLNEWLTWPEEERLTLGVITFNAEQQGLILDLLDEERRKNPDLEWFFEDAREEPVIVKNLENIQGDERDVMLFSITFGPDHAGKLSMAFGALNGDGGEKRLNVAVTRARAELHVFASIRADQIDLTRTRALGVRHLKNFLDFAARGPEALPAQDEGSLGPVENLFEAAIKAAIEAKGWELRPQIGVSGFRIDLGVVHPDHAGIYLAGIECDGATYHGSATARDRDKVRQAVLENLGWTIFRIWSTDWFRNPAAVVERINAALTAHLEMDRIKRAEKDAARKAMRPEQQDEVTEVSNDRQPVAPDTAKPIVNETTAEPDPVRQEAQYSRASAAAVAERSNDAGLDEAIPDPEKFYDAQYIPVLERLIASIVKREGPMPVALLGKRVSGMHGWQRTGRRISGQISKALRLVEIHKEGDTEFLWAAGTKADRLAFRPGMDRSIRDISRTEIANLYDRHSSELNKSEDPVLDLARHAGIARLSADARAYLSDCVAWRASQAS
ncbi:DNA helicase [Ruegeria sp. PBVC088]|nr:DNA helicase [Ruegeria sp. PBVC088]